MSFRSILLYNWHWKLFSLLLATAVWFYIRTSIRGDYVMPRFKAGGVTTLDFSHEFTIGRLTDTADTNTYQIEPVAAEVTVRGDFSLMQELSWDEFHVFVGLAPAPKAAVSAHLITVTPPPGIEVIAVDPPAVLVRRGPENDAPPVPISQP